MTIVTTNLIIDLDKLKFYLLPPGSLTALIDAEPRPWVPRDPDEAPIFSNFASAVRERIKQKPIIATSLSTDAECDEPIMVLVPLSTGEDGKSIHENDAYVANGTIPTVTFHRTVGYILSRFGAA